MPIPTARLLPVLLVPFFAWRVYRRLRRNIGKQLLIPGRVWGLIAVFGLLSLFVAAASFRQPAALEALAGGLALGVALAFVGLRLTRFEIENGKHCYTPNTHIGVTLSLILIGRVAYRMMFLFGSSDAGMSGPALMQSPLTVFMYGLPAGYYIAYYIGVLQHAGRNRIEA
jgi:hypothetical protein